MAAAFYPLYYLFTNNPVPVIKFLFSLSREYHLCRLSLEHHNSIPSFIALSSLGLGLYIHNMPFLPSRIFPPSSRYFRMTFSVWCIIFVGSFSFSSSLVMS